MQAVATHRASLTLCSSQVVGHRAPLPYVALRNQSPYLKKYAKPTRVSFSNLGRPSPKLNLSVSLSSQRQIVPLLAKSHVDFASSSSSVRSRSRRQTISFLAKEPVESSSSSSLSSQRQNVPLLAKEPVDFASSSSSTSVSSSLQKQIVPLLAKEPEDFAPSVSSSSKISRQAVPLLDKEPEDIASSFFGERMPLPFPLGLTRNRSRSSMHVKAYRNDEYINSSMDFCKPNPKDERPEWFWRILATVPYLISLKMSAIAFFMTPFLEKHCGDIGETILNLLPGPANSLNSKLFIAYSTLGYYWMVKNRHLPQFLRFHMVMGMLLDAGLGMFCRTSSFFPLINLKGSLATYHYMVMGFSYACLLLECLRCALAGTYPRIPFFSDAAYTHTFFHLGGWPFDGFFKPNKARTSF